MNPVVLSIITVCYNAESTIQNTIESVLCQTFRNYEYIIIDGASTDGTNCLIKNFIPLFEEKSVPFKYISEPDDGIYHAMNKGIMQAEGEWIAFMNADDRYHTNDILSKIFDNADQYRKYDVLYGSTNHISSSGEKIQKPLKLDFLRNRVVFVHQSAFVKAAIMKQKLFDTSYRLAADYQLFLELWLEGRAFRELDGCVISDFSECGRSAQMSYQSIAELRRIRYRHSIPGNDRIRDWLDYAWWVAVHLGGHRRKGI